MEVSCYAFYGSLRSGRYNFEIYKDHLQYITTQILVGFKLFVLPDYPIAIRTHSDKEKIVVELYKVTDPDIEKEIHTMEMKAGYYFDSIDMSGFKAGIYLFTKAFKLQRSSWWRLGQVY